VDRLGILSLQSAGAGIASWHVMIAASANVFGYGVDKGVRIGEAEHLLLFLANETSPASKERLISAADFPFAATPGIKVPKPGPLVSRNWSSRICSSNARSIAACSAS
jgi:hypothetical protein